MNGANTAQLVSEIVQLILLAGTSGVDLYLKLQEISQLGPDEQTNIHAQIATAIAIDMDTKARIREWRIQQGLEPDPTPDPAPPTEGSEGSD